MDKQYRRVSTNGDRPALLRLLNDTQPDDRVLVWKLDRLARNLCLLLEIEAKLWERDVPLISITEGVDTSTVLGRLIFQMFVGVAELEREAYMERCFLGYRRLLGDI